MDDPFPLHSEPHRTNFLTRGIGYMGWIMAILSFFLLVPGDPDPASFAVFFPTGVILAAVHWFMAPRRYNIFEKELVITYGKPRQRIIPFDDISDVEVKRHALGAEIRIHRSTDKAVSLHPWNPRRFHENLETALNRFRGVAPEDQPPEGSSS